MSDNATQARQPSAEFFRRQRDLILSASGDGIYGIDCEGLSIFVNPAAARMSGYTVEEMLGRDLHALVHHTHPDGRPFPACECPIYEATRDGKVHRIYDDVFWRKDGTSFPVEYISTPIWDEGKLTGAVVSFRDISERKQAEQAVRESEQRYRAMFDGSHAAGFLIDAQTGQVLDENQRTCAMFGYDAPALRQMRAADVFEGPPGEADRFWRNVQQTGGAETEALFGVSKTGLRLPVRLSASEIRYGDRTGVLVLATDLSARRKVEARARSLQNTLNHVSRVSAMGEMASAMAHELNQPLSAVMNYLAAARRFAGVDGLEDSRTLDMVDKAIAQAARAGEIIRSLRAFLDKGEAQTEWASLPDVIEETLHLVDPMVGAAGIQLVCRFEDNAPQTLMQRVNIQQVFINLLRNAVEAMADVKDGVMTVTSSSTPTHVWLEVADQGTGLSKDQKARLFEPFSTAKPDGMGVGLSISQSILSDHEGLIEAENRPEGGAVFRFALPRRTQGARS